MRQLEPHELAIELKSCDQPGETTDVFSHANSRFWISSTLMPNNSTTVNVFYDYTIIYTWNSGIWLSTWIIGSGVGIGVTTFTGNPIVGGLVGALVGYGFGRASYNNPEDGDQYLPNCAIY